MYLFLTRASGTRAPLRARLEEFTDDEILCAFLLSVRVDTSMRRPVWQDLRALRHESSAALAAEFQVVLVALSVNHVWTKSNRLSINTFMCGLGL